MAFQEQGIRGGNLDTKKKLEAHWKYYSGKQKSKMEQEHRTYILSDVLHFIRELHKSSKHVKGKANGSSP